MSKRMKRFLEIAAVVAVLAGVIFAVVKISSIKTRTISSLSFSIGSLSTADGSYVENDQAIYTKDAIECKGLSITPEFDAKASYQVFWYNEDDLYFGCTEVYNNTQKCLNAVPELAKYCRIAIYPAQVDSDGKKVDDFKVKFYEPVKYANELTIKVDKKQNYRATDMYEYAKENGIKNGSEFVSLADSCMFYNDAHVYGIDGTTKDSLNFKDSEVGTGYGKFYAVIKLNCSSVKEYLFSFDEDSVGMHYVFFYTSDGQALRGDIRGFNFTAGQQMRVAVPDGAQYMVINVTPGEGGIEVPYEINEYLPLNSVTKALYD